MEKVKSHLKDTPTYITFDIDGIDPSDCPGTGKVLCLYTLPIHLLIFFFSLLFIHIILFLGTPEVGGLTPVQALEIVRGLRGLNIIGGDVVEVCVRTCCTCVCMHVCVCVHACMCARVCDGPVYGVLLISNCYQLTETVEMLYQSGLQL